MAITLAALHAMTSADPARSARRARYFLYVLGAAFTLLALIIDSRVCALLAVVVLGVGRFGSDRLVGRCERLLAPWP